MAELTATIKGRYIGGGLFDLREGKKKFSACIVLDGDEDLKKIHAARDAAIEEEFGAKPPSGLQDWTAAEGTDEDYASYGGMFINPKSTKKVPVFVRREGRLVPITSEDEIIYAGCHVHASVVAYAYKANPAKQIKAGVTLILRGVQFWKDGEALGNRFNESEFDGLESELDEESLGAEETESSLL